MMNKEMLALLYLVTPFIFCVVAHGICSLIWPKQPEQAQEDDRKVKKTKAVHKMADDRAAASATTLPGAVAEQLQENPVERERRRKKLVAETDDDRDYEASQDFSVPAGFSLAEARSHD